MFKQSLIQCLYNCSSVKKLKDISGHAGRYSLFKVGPCLCGSHGIGMPSLSVVLHEVRDFDCLEIKILLRYFMNVRYS